MRQTLPLLALVLVSLAARPARACRPVPGAPVPVSTDGTLDDPLVWIAASAGAVDTLFLGFQLGYGADGRLFPHVGAGLEGIVAVANLIGSNVAIVAGALQTMNSCGSGRRLEALFGVAGGMAAVGSWLLAHAIWSGSVDENRPYARPSVALDPSGARLTVVGAF